MKHTPGPWGVQIGYRTIQVLAGEHTFVIGMDSEAEANAAFIVRAVNSHYEMLAALKRFVEYGDVFAYKEGEGNPYEQAKAAIAKAEVE